MQDYNTIIGAIQMRLNKCPTRSVMDRFRIGSSTLNLIMSRYKALEPVSYTHLPVRHWLRYKKN